MTSVPVFAAVLALAFAGAAPSTAYPWAHASCEFGTAGGARCTNPTDRSDRYDWGLRGSGGFRRYDAWGYEYRNCTSYVAWRLSRAHKNEFSLLGDASDWPASARARSSAGVVRNHTPTPGAAAVWIATNHVAYVESTTRGVIVSDFNARGTGRYWAPHPLREYDGRAPDWYIHFPARG